MLDKYFEPSPPKRGGICDAFGKPIYPLTGSKALEVRLDLGLSMPLVLKYDSRRLTQEAANGTIGPDGPRGGDGSAGVPGPEIPRDHGFGPSWSSSWHRKLAYAVMNTSGGRTVVSYLFRDAGRRLTYIRNADDFSHQRPAGSRVDLWYLAESGTFFVADYEEQIVEHRYGSTVVGSLTNITGDKHLGFAYSGSGGDPLVHPFAGLLARVTDHSTRARVELHYEAEDAVYARIHRIVDGNGRTWRFAYDTYGNLSTITWPDGAVRRFVYEIAASPRLLTGIIDERGVRYATVGYGANLSTELAGGVNRYAVVSGADPNARPSLRTTLKWDPVRKFMWRERKWIYPPSGPMRLQTPSGQIIDLAVGTAGDGPVIVGKSQPAGSGCAASVMAMSYDNDGNPLVEDNFAGQRTCYAYDARGNRTTKVEGLSTATACASVLTGTSLPAGSRKTSYQYHPDWPLVSRIAEPGRITSYVYQGEPDPTASNQPLNCGPNTFRHGNGKVFAHLCKQVVRATTDADGARGFAASNQAGVPVRTWAWTYDEAGRLLSTNGPRTDAQDTLTYAIHYGVGDGGRRYGKPYQVTNGLGQITTLDHDDYGRVTAVIDPNGIATRYTYDLRDRITSISVAGETTSYTWDPAGLLIKVTQPNGAFMDLSYDGAQRLVGVADSRGNRITYTLDGASNVLSERVNDGAGVLRQEVARTFDALDRLQYEAGAARVPNPMEALR